MRSRRSPSFPSGLAKKKRNPECGGVRRAAAVAASRRRFPRRPRLPFPEAGGCARARGGRQRPRPSARRAAGTIRPDPPGPGVRAHGAWGLRGGGGGGDRGVHWENGARAAPGPQGSGPCWQGIPRGAPGAQVRDGNAGEVEPFCFAGPALLAPPGSRATSAAAAAAATAAPGSARQSRSGAGARGEPGDGRGRGPSWPGISSARPRSRRHHFLLARRCRGRREPGPPARLPPPWPHFSGGANPKEKVSQEGLARARPGRRGLGAAQRQPSGRDRLFLLVLSGAGPTRAAEGKRLSFSAWRSSQLPGASWTRAREIRGARWPFTSRRGPRRGRSPSAHAAPGCWEAAGPGARRGHRRPRRDTHAHTLPPVASLSAAADGLGHRV